MNLGIISDTHDNIPMIEKAIGLFNRMNVDLVLHAGDYVSPFSLKPFWSLNCRFLGVWGNNDGDKIALDIAANKRIAESPRMETLGEREVLLGHYFETLDALVSSQQFFLIVYGHTHRPEIRKHGETLVVNPGECGGWLYGHSTVALVNMDEQTGEIVAL